MRVIKFLLTGLVGISVNLGVFHISYLLGVPYLAGSIMGLSVSMGVGFILQKYWTFEDHATERLHTQLAFYVLLALANLAINTSIVYMLVDKVGVFYLLAQTIGAGLVAVDSFFIYRAFIFSPLRSDSEGSQI